MSFTDVTPFEPLILKSHFKWDSNIIKVCEELIESAKHPAHLEKNDGKVGVSETRLSTPHEFCTVVAGHSWICHTPAVVLIAKEFFNRP